MSDRLASGALGLALCVASLALHVTAHAEPSENPGELPSLAELQSACAPEVELRRRSLTVEGQPGIWFDERVAACMASRLALATELRQLVTALELRVERTDAHVVLLERQLELSREIEARLEEALTLSFSETVPRWHRRPALWWAVGVVSTVALQVVALRTVGALGD